MTLVGNSSQPIIFSFLYTRKLSYQMRLTIFISPYSRYIYTTGSTHDDKHNQFRCSLSHDRSPIQNNETSHSYVFCWVIPLRLNFMCGSFGTVSLFHLHRQVAMKMVQSVPKRWHLKFRRQEITQQKAYNLQHTAYVFEMKNLTYYARACRLQCTFNSYIFNTY